VSEQDERYESRPEPIERVDDDPQGGEDLEVEVELEGMPEPAPVEDFEPEEYESADAMRSAIFESDDIPEELVPVPEWKVNVLVRGMSGNESVAIMEGAGGQREKGKDGATSVDFAKMYPDIVILTAYHPGSRQRLFRPDVDRKAILAKSGAALNRVAMKGMQLSGLTKEATNDAGKD